MGDEQAGAVDQLRERMKELAALHALAKLMCQPFSTCEELFRQIAALVPPSMLHAEDCTARLCHGEIEVCAPPDAGKPVSTLQRAFETSDGTRGVIEIGYLHEHEAHVEGPFLAEERALVDSIAELVCVAIDRRIMEGAVHKAARLEAMGALAASVAHDFNNLLGSIQANASFLVDELKKKTDSDTYGAAEDILAASERGAELAKQLVTLGRKPPPRGHSIDVNATIEKLVPLLRPLLGDKVQLEIDLTSGIGRVDLEASELDRVLMNLVVNARDAMPSGGTVRVRTHTVNRNGGPFARISVSDDGAGIERTLLPRIFEPYFTTKPEGRGTGLGLAVVWRVVSEAGGQVEVESEPGKGATFQVDIPRI